MKPINLFVNRERELSYLNKLYKKKGRKLVILYGRRRVGKTELINQFSKGKKAIYFLADKRGTLSNAERFSAICADYFKDTRPAVRNFDDAFLYVKKHLRGEKLIIAIDEFSYLVEKDDGIPSVFQLIFDEILKGTDVFLILSGSSMSMMYRGALSYESPLYGRRSGDWMLRAMPFRDFSRFYPGLSFEELVMVYSVVGGIPAYAVHFGGRDVFDAIKLNVLRKGEFLYSEPEVLLKEELREPSTYFAILEAMASNAKLTDIANAARIPAKDMPKYLKVLEDLDLVYKATPVTEKKTRKSLYFIKDNFFNFWFRFVYPRKSELEGGNVDEVLKLIKKDFNSHVGRVFEQICREYVEQKKLIQFSRVGKWWGYLREKGRRRVEEIDVVALDESSRKILFGECKWQEKVDGYSVLSSLKEKAEKVEWHKEEREEQFVVFAKSFAGKPKEKNCLFLDAVDLGRWVRSG
ncbi:MAG: ATP-binding protein [Candidatus Micrarchaeia archaeon]